MILLEKNTVLGPIMGTWKDDHIIHHRDPSILTHTGTGLMGLGGDDTLEGSVSNMGQIHMMSATGDDYLILDVKKIRDAEGTQGHHAFGGHGADTFDFTNIAENHAPIIGRLDDFDPSIDKIKIEGKTIDLYDLPKTLTLSSGEKVFVRVIEIEHPEYVGEKLGTQQFLAIGDNIFYALEGARDLSNGTSGLTGEERHFLHPDSLEALRAAESVQYTNPHNFVPYDYYRHREDELTLVWTPPGAVVRIESDAENPVHVFGGKNNSEAHSSAGAQVIRTGSGADIIDANTGNDTIYASAGNDLVSGGIDDDHIYGQNGDDILWGGDGNDMIRGGRGDDLIFGGNGDDFIHGGSGSDTLKGEAGNDTIHGGGGNDHIYGGTGHDRLTGGNGNDKIFGGSGNDKINGNRGRDQIDGGSGDDIISGGKGHDTISGGDGEDLLLGGKENDFIRGGSGDDTIRGGQGDDTLGGDRGNDLIIGGAGNDLILGGPGDDTLIGGTGDDLLGGGGGDDRIIGGPGDDTARGSQGADTFVFNDNDGSLLIENFRMSDNDQLELDSSIWDDVAGALTAEQVVLSYGEIIDGNLVLDFGPEIIFLEGVGSLTNFWDFIDIT